MGPSSVTVGPKTVWVGNRGDDQVCAFDRTTLARGACVKLPAMPDGIAYVGTTGEVWACTDGAVALDLGHGAASVGRLKTGGGVDNLDYDPGRKLLYVASAKDGTLTVARVGTTGALTAVATVPTAKGGAESGRRRPWHRVRHRFT